MNGPRVGIVVPTFNRWPLVCDTLDSILAQTYESVHVILVDDGSTDGTSRLAIDRYGSRITVLRQENLGEAAARNKGIAECPAEVVGTFDSDDIMPPTSIEVRVDALVRSNHTEALVLGKSTPTTAQPFIARRLAMVSRGIEASLMTGLAHHHNAALFPKRAFLSTGGYRKDLWLHGDRDILMRLASILPTVVIDDTVHEMRDVAQGRMTTAWKRIHGQQRRWSALLEDYLPDDVCALVRPIVETIEDEELARAAQRLGARADFQAAALRLARRPVLAPKRRLRWLRRYVTSIFRWCPSNDAAPTDGTGPSDRCTS